MHSTKPSTWAELIHWNTEYTGAWLHADIGRNEKELDNLKILAK